MSLSQKEAKNQLSTHEQDHATMDQAIERLNAQKQTWATLAINRKIEYFQALISTTEKVAERWVAAAIQAKGIPANSPLTGEEWDSGPWALLYGLNRYIETLQSIAKTGYPALKSGSVHTRPDGQVVVDVFPQSGYDRLLLNGITGQVWMQPGVTAENLRETMAVWYRTANPVGKLALVLGAGNIASIAPLDVLYKLIAEGQVVLLKMNPVNDYLGPIFEEVFAPLIRDGFVQLAYGGVAAGQYLCTHPGIEEIHITGSASTHDAIVFGAGEERDARKQHGEPLNTRRITSELGNVSPTIVVPGPWTKADLQFQAENIVTQKMHNAGFNCIASQVVILPQSWNQTEALLDAVRGVIRATPARAAYYPGASKRQHDALQAHPDAEILDTAEGTVPRTLVHQVSNEQVASGGDDFCFRVEAFGSVLTETRLPGNDPATFLHNAVDFCNNTLWGTLGANIIIHPATMKALGPVFDQAVADLKYGCIAVNAWTGVGFLLAQTTWGAFPGHTLADIQSGIGVVHNSLLFDRAQKSVVQAPFYPYPRSFLNGVFTVLPRPPWFVTNKTAGDLGRKLVHFEAHPGIGKLPGILVTALRG